MTSPHPFVEGFDDLLVLARSGVLDPEWYLCTYADVRSAGVDPYEHYLAQGWREGRDPGPCFRTRWYLDANPDVAQHGINPLLHYLLEGWREGRLPFEGFVAPPEASLVPEVCPLIVALALADESLPGRPNTLGRGEADHEARIPAEPSTWGPGATPLRTVAFYLPQFHPIPENDEWWGEGFTEWTNVRRGRPRFAGHVQPHVPTELGYYDLRDPVVLRRQVDLAKRYGVSAFCFYAYWFGGRRLLERPLDAFVADTSLDLEFCVCWANENWTRTWDGEARQVLIAQEHSPEDDLAFIDSMSPYLRDPRYLRVDGRPLILVYRPSQLPDPAATAGRWREWCRDSGIGEIELAYVESFERGDPRRFGFDRAVEFPPNSTGPIAITSTVQPEEGFAGTVYDGRELAARSGHYPERPYPLWRGVCTSWDNEARRPGRGAVLAGMTPSVLFDWLVNAGRDTVAHEPEPDRRLVFVNAWNEWAEGAHLEPDEANGFGWLNAVRAAQERVAGITDGTGPGVVVVIHDLHPHGAQLGALALATELKALGRRVEVVALDGGQLRSRFEDVGRLHVLPDLDHEAVQRLPGDLVGRGYRTALCNSSVTGGFAALLAAAGVHVVGLVHELPGVLADEHRARNARALTSTAHTLVFPAERVRDAFPFPIPDACDVRIRAQGVYLPIPDDAAAGRRFRLEHGVPEDAWLALAVGFGDHRKGIDLLAAATDALPEEVDGRPVHVVWLGHVDRYDTRVTDALERADTRRFHVVPFTDDPRAAYQAADLVALPSREDPFPSVVLEALSAGLPVVALRGATGTEDLVTTNGGVLVDEDPARLASGMVGVLRDDTVPARAERRAAAARDHAYRPYVLDLLASTPAAVPRVSVVVPNYQYGRLIADRLDQVFRQTYPVYEVVVLDDASTDDSSERIQAALLDRVPSVRFLENASNSGSVYRQWALGVAATRGDLVWIAEADDVADARYLERMVPRVTTAGAVMAFCQSRQLGVDGEELAPDYLEYVSDVVARDWTRPYVSDGTEELRRCLSVKNTVPNVSAVIFDGPALRQSLAALPDLATEFPTAGDWRVYVELLSRGGLIAFEPEALNGHRRHSGSVIARGLGASHIDEIRRMQEYVASVVTVTDSARAAAHAFTVSVEEALLSGNGR